MECRSPAASNLMDDLERRLEAVCGWLYLGLAEEAALELDGVAWEHRLDPEVLKTHARVLQTLQRWESLRNVARMLCDALPEEPRWPILLASATRHLHGPERALGILMEAVEQFPSVPTVYYDLACCEAEGGYLDNARLWLKEAFKLNSGLRVAARADLRLAALHDVK